jgi:quinol monooxygenase YgiN
MKHIEILEQLEACDEAVEWAKGYESLEHAWNECKIPDWMLWLDDNMGLFTDKERRLLACRFVRETPIGDGRTVWDLLTDERSRNSVIVAEKFANGEATQEELATASATAWDAAWDAARYAAWYAARYAAWATARDAASATASAAAWDAAWDVQCDIIRSYGNPFNENTKKEH